jgi:hypothetical protein
MAAPQSHGKEPARTPARTPTPALKRGEYLGRGGKILRREREASHNPFDFPDSLKENGWSYQWCRADILGSGEFSEISKMRRVGWDYVKPDQLEGYFAHDCKDMDHIEVAGMVLMERPEQMTQDARDEQLREANKHFAAQVNKRADIGENPLPPGVVPMLREISGGQSEPNPNAHKPQYARVTAPAGDDE